MTPKEKAKELLDKYRNSIMSFLNDNMKDMNAKQCALITINQLIIQNGDLYLNGINESYYRKLNSYLFEVKQEIENL